jgi:hypothetical protein
MPRLLIKKSSVKATAKLKKNIDGLCTRQHCKKRLAVFPSPAGMSLTKLSLAGIIELFPARERLVSDIPAGDWKTVYLFLQCTAIFLIPLFFNCTLPSRNN